MKLAGIGSLIILLASLVAPAQARTWRLSEVSVLLPLTEKMIPPGELLPASVYRKHPMGFVTEFGADSAYPHLRVVGLRVDPIEQQIRLVWQPVFFDREARTWSTEDFAGHTFYQLGSGEFTGFLQEWTALVDQVRVEPTGLSRLLRDKPSPLNVHPAFSDTKLGAIFSAGIARLLKKYCGSRNLVQYTAMRLMSADHTWWSFSGIELRRAAGDRGEWQPIKIPRIKEGEVVGNYSRDQVDFFNLETELDPRAREVTGMRGQFNFAFDDDTDLRPVFNLPTRPTSADRPQLLRAFAHVSRFQNPSLTSPKNLDCVSCHVAQPVRLWMTNSLSGLKLPPEQQELDFKNPDPRHFDLRNPTLAVKSTRILRAFGYFGSKPAMNQRVIHETATVADWLNQRSNSL